MNLWRHAGVLLKQQKNRVISGILAHRVRYLNPSMTCHPTAIWDYGFADVDAISLGKNVSVLAHAHIVVQKRAARSRVEGRLSLGDNAIIGEGANIRAAGGVITIGARSGVGQHSVLVAANHRIDTCAPYLFSDWDEVRTGIHIGSNVWIGALSVILPGVTIGDNSVIAAGSVVNKCVPPGELWAGVPACRIKTLRPREGLTDIRAYRA